MADGFEPKGAWVDEAQQMAEPKPKTDRVQVEGVDYSAEGIMALREALIAMRGKAMSNWPEGIDDTVVLSHAIALMADYAEIRRIEDEPR